MVDDSSYPKPSAKFIGRFDLDEVARGDPHSDLLRLIYSSSLGLPGPSCAEVMPIIIFADSHPHISYNVI
jgi:hypothetical protein